MVSEVTVSLVVCVLPTLPPLFSPGFVYRKRKAKVPWMEYEEKNLRDGITKYGVGQWSKILRAYKFDKVRDGTSLKDKYRNLKKNGLI